MVDINHNTKWFLSADGVAEFERITTLEERTLFIQAFLEKLTEENKNEVCLYERETTNFRFALFLADAIYGSILPYSKYPALIDQSQNPFIGAWKHRTYGKPFAASRLSSVLFEESNRLFPDSTSAFKKTLIEENKALRSEDFGEAIFLRFPSATIFDVDPALESIQLKIMCLFK